MEGMGETWSVHPPIPRKFEISDTSDEVMMEVEWRDEEPYMTPIKMGKKRNKGKGVKRPETPERPIPNMPQTPCRRMLEIDWTKPASEVTNEKKEIDLEAFIGEYLRNTNGLRDCTICKEQHDESDSEWCGEQANYMAARQNHTDVAIRSMRDIANEVKEQVELGWEYDKAPADKLDDRLSKIQKRLARIALVNMAKTIENAMRDCMEKMVEQVTDQVVGKLEKLAEKERREEI